MTLTHYITKNYENKPELLTMEKQSQTNPILSAVALAKAVSKGILTWSGPDIAIAAPA
jgi:hypothetical protein